MEGICVVLIQLGMTQASIDPRRSIKNNMLAVLDMDMPFFRYSREFLVLSRLIE